MRLRIDESRVNVVVEPFKSRSSVDAAGEPVERDTHT